MAGLLEVKNLTVSFDTEQGEIQAVRDVSLSLKAGEVLALVGESGCGKSVLCKSIMKLLPGNARYRSGSITLDGVDITGYRQRDMERLRGSLFSMVFQNPMTALNPAIPIGEQIAEAVRLRHPDWRREAVYGRVLELMRLVGIGEPQERYRLYPHSFSGGMRQRSVLAMALASDPRLLFADEPTTALDVTVQAQILELFREIQRKLGTATLLVSHDLGVVARAADRVAVMYAGRIVEIGTAEEVYYDARHPYTWGLMRALPAFAKEGEELYTIPGLPPGLIHPPPGDAFACRNEYALAIDYERMPPMFRITDTHYAATWLLDERAPRITSPLRGGLKELLSPGRGFMPGTGAPEPGGSRGTKKDNIREEILLEVRHLTHHFRISKRMVIPAVEDVSFCIKRGEIFGLVGESGSGKSTLARCIMNICRPSAGEILYKGVNVCDPKQFRQHRKMLQTSRQLIFQDSDSSLNQRMKVADIIGEPMAVSRRTPPRGSLRAEARFQLRAVGMDVSCLDRYPPELSGGMRQRAAIARALSMEPELLVADEPVASLDVSIQAQILNLFKHLQKEHGFTFLFIAHDLAVVRYLCDRVGVLHQGKMVEVAETRELFENPRHPYTRLLLSSIPRPDPGMERAGRMKEKEEGGRRR